MAWGDTFWDPATGQYQVVGQNGVMVNPYEDQTAVANELTQNVNSSWQSQDPGQFYGYIAGGGGGNDAATLSGLKHYDPDAAIEGYEWVPGTTMQSGGDDPKPGVTTPGYWSPKFKYDQSKIPKIGAKYRDKMPPELADSLLSIGAFENTPEGKQKAIRTQKYITNQDAVFFDPEYGWVTSRYNIPEKEGFDWLGFLGPTLVTMGAGAFAAPGQMMLVNAAWNTAKGLATGQDPLKILANIAIGAGASYLGDFVGQTVADSFGLSSIDTGIPNPFGKGNFSIDPSKIVGGYVKNVVGGAANKAVGNIMGGNTPKGTTPRTGTTSTKTSTGTTTGSTNMAEELLQTQGGGVDDPRWTDGTWGTGGGDSFWDGFGGFNGGDPNNPIGEGGNGGFGDGGGYSGQDIDIFGGQDLGDWGFLGETFGGEQDGTMPDGSWDWLKDLMPGGGGGMDPYGLTALQLAGVMGPLALKQYMDSGKWEEMGNNAAVMADPFGAQRAQYAQKLSDLYTHPDEYLENPEHRAVVEKQLNRIQSRNRAAGYMGSGKDNTDMADFQAQADAQYLDKEKERLASLAGSQFSPANSAEYYMKGGTNAMNAQNLALGTLGSIFTGMIGARRLDQGKQQNPNITINNTNNATGGGAGGSGGAGNFTKNFPAGAAAAGLDKFGNTIMKIGDRVVGIMGKDGSYYPNTKDDFGGQPESEDTYNDGTPRSNFGDFSDQWDTQKWWEQFGGGYSSGYEGEGTGSGGIDWDNFFTFGTSEGE